MTELVRVFRIEKNGIGPWQSRDFNQLKSALSRRFYSSKHERHSTRTVNMQDYNISDFLFGFYSLNDLEAYFGKRLINMMVRRGFQIRLYDVNRKFVLEGDGEIAFAEPGTTPVSWREKVKMKKDYVSDPVGMTSVKTYSESISFDNVKKGLEMLKNNEGTVMQELVNFYFESNPIKY